MMKRDWEVWDEKTVDFIEQTWGSPTKGNPIRHQRLIETVSTHIEGGSVLDVGCGLGHLYPYLEPKIETYLGVDSSPVMIKRAQSHFGEHLFVVGDAYDLSPQPMMDTVVCCDVVKHVPETWPILEQLWSKANKHVILVTNIGPIQRTKKTPKGDGKYLIYRFETTSNLMTLFHKLSNLETVKVIPFKGTKNTVIFKLNKKGKLFEDSMDDT